MRRFPLANKVLIPAQESEIRVTRLNEHIFDGKVLEIDNGLAHIIGVSSPDKKRRSIYAVSFTQEWVSFYYQLFVKVTQDKSHYAPGSFSITFESDRSDIRTARPPHYANAHSLWIANKIMNHFDYLFSVFDAIGSELSAEYISRYGTTYEREDFYCDSSQRDRDRATFEALSDGTDLNYDDWKKSGGDLDGLFTSKGLD